MESEDPTMHFLSTENEEPLRTKVRIDRVAPKAVKSSIDTEFMCDLDSTGTDVPIRAQFRREKEEPMYEKSKTATADPRW